MKFCSLLPSSTEILFALGLGDQVIAVTHECDYSPAAVLLVQDEANRRHNLRGTK